MRRVFFMFIGVNGFVGSVFAAQGGYDISRILNQEITVYDYNARSLAGVQGGISGGLIAVCEDIVRNANNPNAPGYVLVERDGITYLATLMLHLTKNLTKISDAAVRAKEDAAALLINNKDLSMQNSRLVRALEGKKHEFEDLKNIKKAIRSLSDTVSDKTLQNVSLQKFGEFRGMVGRFWAEVTRIEEEYNKKYQELVGRFLGVEVNEDQNSQFDNELIALEKELCVRIVALLTDFSKFVHAEFLKYLEGRYNVILKHEQGNRITDKEKDEKSEIVKIIEKLKDDTDKNNILMSQVMRVPDELPGAKLASAKKDLSVVRIQSEEKFPCDYHRLSGTFSDGKQGSVNREITFSDPDSESEDSILDLVNDPAHQQGSTAKRSEPTEKTPVNDKRTKVSVGQKTASKPAQVEVSEANYQQIIDKASENDVKDAIKAFGKISKANLPNNIKTGKAFYDILQSKKIVETTRQKMLNSANSLLKAVSIKLGSEKNKTKVAMPARTQPQRTTRRNSK